jgi:hypothetical protein
MSICPDAVFAIDGDGDLARAYVDDPRFAEALVDAKLTGKDPVWNELVPISFGPVAKPGLSGFVPTDCPYFAPLSNSLMLSQRALNAFGLLSNGAGLLFRTVEDGDGTNMNYSILYVRREVDALDKMKSEVETLPSGAIVDIRHHVFHADRLLQSPIFRLPRFGKIYVTNTIAGLIEQHRLTGFRLRRVWSATTGGIRQSLLPTWSTEFSPEEKERKRDTKRRALRAELAARQAAG